MRSTAVLCLGFLFASVAGGLPAPDKRTAAEAKELSLLLPGLRFARKDSQCVPAGQVAYGQTVTGELTQTDCLLPSDGSYVDYWQFQGTAGDVVVIDLSASDFDTYLGLQDGSGAVAAQNDDFGNGTNSHVAFTLTNTGTWVISCTSLFPQITGSYSLTLQGVPAAPPGSCATATSLCLQASRFTVSVTWATTDGRTGTAQAVSLTDDTGYFWFFDAGNVELVVKVLDARGVNGHFWVFYGALSNVRYTITVEDTTGRTRRTYENPQGNMASVADTSAF
jgi:Bacterial pre-peptidase C-terminal domain